ncbi:MAG TPA: hypothetical protein VFI27_11305 [candidate division Zixibacteria bacterium]|nr:hypothetical protein [candidate division Zixibacteria bacterium]
MSNHHHELAAVVPLLQFWRLAANSDINLNCKRKRHIAGHQAAPDSSWIAVAAATTGSPIPFPTRPGNSSPGETACTGPNCWPRRPAASWAPFIRP